MFVYGTLQDPAVRATVIGDVVVREVGRGTVAGALYDLGDYPGLLDADESQRVPGTVLEIPDISLARLDHYEGVHVGLYAREIKTVRLDDGTEIDAFVYVYTASIAGRPRVARWPA